MQIMDPAHHPPMASSAANHASGQPARSAAVYHGVWTRTSLETPAGRDSTSRVQWVQTACWQGAVDGQGHMVTPDVEAPGAPHSVFQTPDRIVQTGLHDRHLAIWERLPGSRGRRVTLARRGSDGQPTAERLLLCGDYLLHLMPQGDTTALAFGRLDAGQAVWRIEQASDPAQVGTCSAWHLQRLGMDLATIPGDGPLAGAWEVLEWTEA